MEIMIATDNDIRLIKKLYKRAFPKTERVPFMMIMSKSSKNKIDILAIKQKTKFLGLVITSHYKDLVLVNYFAISEDKRGAGIGSNTLQLLRKYYDNKRIFLEIEPTEIKSKNIIQREKRKNFYLKNSYIETEIYADTFFGKLQILCDNCKITIDEYNKINEYSLGKLYAKIINPKIIEKL